MMVPAFQINCFVTESMIVIMVNRFLFIYLNVCLFTVLTIIHHKKDMVHNLPSNLIMNP